MVSVDVKHHVYFTTVITRKTLPVPETNKKQKQTTTSSFFLLLFLRVIGVYFSWDGPNLGILSEPVWPSGKALGW